MTPIPRPADPLEDFLSSVPEGWSTYGLDHLACKSILEILYDNKLTLFPGYTDHGIRHVCEVLRWVDFLIAKQVRAQSVLGSTDHAVLIMAVLLHDLAMHIQPTGFMALISGETSHAPVEWFKKHRNDHPWKKVWEDFYADARKFDDRKLTVLFGSKVQVRLPPADVSKWETQDRLLAGEFIRRHHARLAHEIALHGFPGIPHNVFPGLVPRMHELADLAGVVARSHGMGLREVLPYLKTRHGSWATPQNVAATYLMALLRVADYLQLQSARAPVILMHLRQPLGPVSLNEWEKHAAVSYVGEHDDDHAAIHVQVTPGVSHRTLLQLLELFTTVQAEMDTSSAVLREIYGSHATRQYRVLELARTRLTHNADDPEFTSELPYVPVPTRFRSEGIDLLYQLVKPLYNYDVTLAVRELLQNAVDAVRELEALVEDRPQLRHALRQGDTRFEGDVRVRLATGPAGQVTLTVEDRGVGMTPRVVRDYFLTIGVSYRSSDEWERLHMDEGRVPRVYRSGRFGVGVLAAFLLGDMIEVTTRHWESERGVRFRASIPDDLIELQWVDGVPVGTTVSVMLNENALRPLRPVVDPEWSGSSWRAEATAAEFLDWYTMEWPKVVMEVDDRQLSSGLRFPLPETRRRRWRRFEFDGYPEIQWSFSGGAVACNGILVNRSSRRFLYETQAYVLSWPSLSVIDPSARLRLNLQRTEIQWEDEFPRALAIEIARDMLAYALLRGPTARMDGGRTPIFAYDGLLSRGQHSFLQLEEGYALWDPEIVSAVGVNSLILSDDSFGFSYPGLAPRTAHRSGADAWVDPPENPAQRALSVLRTAAIANHFATLPGIYTSASLVVVRREIRDYVLHWSEQSKDWKRSPPGASFDERELGDGWYLLKTVPWIHPSYDPAAAIVGVSEGSGGRARIALAEFEIRGSSDGGLLRDTWLDLIGNRPIPYDPERRKSELAHAWEELAYYVEAWENDLDKQSGG
ncbi:MAG TPA: ATP-binding protein [Longimicrobium sp.]|jgi:hypothetical protein